MIALVCPPDILIQYQVAPRKQHQTRGAKRLVQSSAALPDSALGSVDLGQYRGALCIRAYSAMTFRLSVCRAVVLCAGHLTVPYGGDAYGSSLSNTCALDCSLFLTQCLSIYSPGWLHGLNSLEDPAHVHTIWTAVSGLMSDHDPIAAKLYWIAHTRGVWPGQLTSDMSAFFKFWLRPEQDSMLDLGLSTPRCGRPQCPSSFVSMPTKFVAVR